MTGRARAILILLILALPLQVHAGFVSHSARSAFLLTSPGTSTLGLLGHVNPAQLTWVAGPEGAVAWTQERPTSLAGAAGTQSRDWAVLSAVPHVGYSSIHLASTDLTEHRLALSGGDRRLAFGAGYGWQSHAGLGPRRRHAVLGALARPCRWLSAGGTLTSAVGHDGHEAAGELALRPLGSPRLTLFADGVAADAAGGGSTWSAGGVLEVVPGVQLAGRVLEGRGFTLGVHLAAGRGSVESQARYDDDRNHQYNTYLVRLGTPERSAVTRLAAPHDRYLQLELDGPVRYRRYSLFDDSRTLSDLVVLLRHVRQDRTVAGLAVNLSGLAISQEASWELRCLLDEVRRSGKQVVVYMDRADLPRYYLASVADCIVLDPAGMLMLPGFASGRTYFRGTLDKLGVGFDEWRLFQFKSAFEDMARTEMSPADRQQRQELLDDLHEQTRKDICAARGLAEAAFDSLVNQTTLFLPQQAVAAHLVDRLGRWADVDSVVQDLTGRPHRMDLAELPAATLDESWRQSPRLAVVYALGVTELYEGMSARSLAADLDEVRNDPSVAAVVLRVDSPGGDALAADLVSESVRRCAQQKPVIVSQGQVAASGGYWVSIYGDTIVAAPSTITGSIGVIGGWVYDRGLKQRLGVTTDHVQVGDHADLMFGASLLGATLPDRNLRPDERARVDEAMLQLYHEFVAKVADGRGSPLDAVEAVAQGHVWSGLRARDRGLVDVLGGLDRAIDLARQSAGIPDGQPMQLVEYPRMSLFDPGILRPDLPLVVQSSEALHRALLFRLEHNGQPLPLLPSDLSDTITTP